MSSTVFLPSGRQGIDKRVVAAFEMLKNSAAGGDIDFEQIAKSVNLSTSRLRHLFTLEAGMSPRHYVRLVRFCRARRLMLPTIHRISTGSCEGGSGKASEIQNRATASGDNFLSDPRNSSTGVDRLQCHCGRATSVCYRDCHAHCQRTSRNVRSCRTRSGYGRGHPFHREACDPWNPSRSPNDSTRRIGTTSGKTLSERAARNESVPGAWRGPARWAYSHAPVSQPRSPSNIGSPSDERPPETHGSVQARRHLCGRQVSTLRWLRLQAG